MALYEGRSTTAEVDADGVGLVVLILTRLFIRLAVVRTLAIIARRWPARIDLDLKTRTRGVLLASAILVALLDLLDDVGVEQTNGPLNSDVVPGPARSARLRVNAKASRDTRPGGG